MTDFRICVINGDFLSKHQSMPQGYEWYEDKVVINSQHYKTIFGERRKTGNGSRKFNAYIKITSGKKSVVRQCICSAIAYVGGIPAIYISAATSSLLTGEYSTNKSATLSKGCWFNYFWNHPNSATKVSFIIGIISLSFSIVSIILSMISSLKSCCCMWI